MRRTAALTAVAGVALTCAAPAVAGHAIAASTRHKTVHIGDYYFSPHKLRVKPKTTITWKWPSLSAGGDVHDVKLVKGPKGVKHFKSRLTAGDYHFTKKLTRTGTYRFICTIHTDMKLTVVVRK
jgi:plastocyanin